jgi:hypothetical protein
VTIKPYQHPTNVVLYPSQSTILGDHRHFYSKIIEELLLGAALLRLRVFTILAPDPWTNKKWLNRQIYLIYKTIYTIFDFFKEKFQKNHPLYSAEYFSSSGPRVGVKLLFLLVDNLLLVRIS